MASRCSGSRPGEVVAVGAANPRHVPMGFPPDLELRVKGIDMKTLPEDFGDFQSINSSLLSSPFMKTSGDEAPNWEAIANSGCPIIVLLPYEGCLSNPLTPSPAAGSAGNPDSPTFFYTDNLSLHHGSHSAHPVVFYVSSGHIMKKHIRSGVATGLARQPIEMLLNRISGGHMAIQSVEKIELACYLPSGGLAPVTSGGNIFPIWIAGGSDTTITMMRRLFSLFKRSGTTSAPYTNPEVIIDMGTDPLWIVDSGAGASLTGDCSLLEGIHPAPPLNFIVANGEAVPSDTCGRASGRVNLSCVRYAPGCHQNIISARHLVRLGCEVNFNRQGCTIMKDGTLIGKAPPATEPEGLYYLDYLRDAQLDSICSACTHPRAQGN